jgi:hypothetical protein
LNDEIERKKTIKDLNEYQSQPVLTFENHGSIKKKIQRDIIKKIP